MRQSKIATHHKKRQRTSKLTAKHLKYTHSYIHSAEEDTIPCHRSIFLVKYILWEKEIWLKYQTTWMDWQISSTSILNDEVKLQIGIRETRKAPFLSIEYLFSSQVSDPDPQQHSSNITVKKKKKLFRQQQSHGYYDCGSVCNNYRDCSVTINVTMMSF